MEKRKSHFFAVVIVSAIAIWAPNTPAKTFNGATSGSFAVSPTGAATYTIPIEVPPGINGLQPQLALAYNSQGGNGPLGVGWSLSGLSAVSRCGATFDQDGYKGGVKVDASDRYCLDGQRLVVVTGSYGGIGATYRTEIDGGAKISATMYGSGNPASFQVESKTGLINRYGYSSDGLWQGSRIEHGASTTAREWLLAEMQNTLGNKVFYRYYEDNANGYHRIESIEYNNGEARIEFKYAPRTDVITVGIAGVMTTFPETLANIQTYVGNVLIRDYQLKYDEGLATSRSRLGQVTECLFDGQCKVPVIIKKIDSVYEAGFTNETWTVPNAWGGAGYTWVGDFNGDGLADNASAYGGNVYMHLSTGKGFTSQTWTVPAAWGGAGYTWLGDFNGDGLSDIASAYGGNVYMKLSTGSGFTSQTWTVPAAWGEAGYTWLGDFNGDGLSDIASAKFGNVYMHLSTGKGFTSQTWTVPNAWGGAGYTWLGDFNGDGLSDIASAYGGNVYMKLSTGSGFTSQTWTVPAAWGEAGYTWLGDFNGDGLSDIASAKFGNVYVHLTSSPLTDLMATIGSSAYSTVVYKSLGSNSVYNTYPYSGIIPISNVASSVETDNGIGGRNVTNYHYEGAKTHRLGRGFLGFEKVTAATTGQNNVTAITETNYYQMSQAGLTYALPFAQRDFWRNGMVESEITKIDGVVQSTTTNTWAHRASDMNQVIPYLASSTTIEREPSSGQIVATKISTTDSIDQYGNVTQTTDKVFEGQYDVGNNYISVSKSEYLLPSNFPTVWLPSQVKKQTVNRTIPYDIGNATKPENRSSTNTVEYEYYSNGQLWKEKIEPLDTKLWLTKTYEYDPVYGHVRKATTTGAGVTQARWLQTDINYNFSPSQYEVTTTNALGHVERRYVAKATGATLAQIGPNGIVGVNGYTTEWVYDGWGRKVEERRADGNVSTWNYIDCAGNYTCEQGEMFFVKAENPGAPWVTVYYDTLGSEVRSLRPSFNYSSTGTTIVSRKQYDSLGRELGSSDAHFSNASAHWSCNEYDNYGRLITRSVPTTIKCSDLTYLDPLVSFEYWGLETRETKHNDGSSGPQTTVQRKNPIGQLVAVQDAMSNPETKYFYNSQGSLVLVEDAKGNQIKTSYDNRGRKVAMDDPDMGHWEYAYNAIGELTSQQNAKLQIVSMTYDALGRMTRRNEPDGSFSSWSYDSGYKAIGKLVSSQNSQSGFSRSIAYDDFGRLKTGTTNILFSPYQMDTAYDQYGRVSTVTYPIRATGDRFVVLNCYDESGYLKEVRQPGVCFSGTGHLWKANAVNASGQVTSETLGNGMNTLRVYDGVWGRLTDITTGSGSTVQMSSFVYDRLGNLAERRWMGTDISGQNQVETFGYDSLNRLTSANLVGIKTTNYSYDAIGNILSKSDFGNDYYYGNDGVRPHAVRNVYNNGVLKASYAYDANGFMTAGNGRTIQPTWFGQPYEMTKGANFSRFGYDIENNRVVQTTEKGFTVYLNPRIDTGSTYEKTTQSGVVTHKHYLYASSGVIGVFEAMESATTGASQGTKTKYFHKDHLGSVEVVTDQNKSVLARYSYDAFGKNRDSNLGGFLTDTSSILQVTPHRFTAHEHMDNMGIIHMNGRTYDPELGRFMSADPNIDGAANPQGYNRFSYLQNNPLNAIDPSGYKKFWKKKWFKKLAFVAIAAVAIYAGGAYILANGFTSSVMIGAGVGAAIGGYAGYQADGISGMWKGAIVGAAIGGLTGAAGANLSAGYGAVTSGAVQGMFSGFGSGVALGYQGGKGSFNSIVDTSLAGAAVGAAVGGAIGYANKWLSSGKWPSGPSESFAPRGNGEWTVSINGVRDEIIHAGITQLYNSLGQQLTTNLVTAYVVTHQQDVEGEIKKKKSGEVNAGCKLDGNDNLDRCSVSAS